MIKSEKCGNIKLEIRITIELVSVKKNLQNMVKYKLWTSLLSSGKIYM